MLHFLSVSHTMEETDTEKAKPRALKRFRGPKTEVVTR